MKFWIYAVVRWAVPADKFKAIRLSDELFVTKILLEVILVDKSVSVLIKDEYKLLDDIFVPTRLDILEFCAENALEIYKLPVVKKLVEILLEIILGEYRLDAVA